MTTDNRRKEEKSKANTADAGRNSAHLTNGVMVDEAGKERSLLPSKEHTAYITSIERVVDSHNMKEAYNAVIRNKGAPGVDGISTEEIKEVIKKKWPQIKQDILDGKYVPNPVRRVEFQKPDGSGVRQLGIPTVLDRIIQQAIYQELVYVFNSTFSDHSYGFRPRRSAHQAVLQAQRYIQEGYDWVVDIDLEKFFDRINHDMLMARVARRVKDKKILLLIRKYLEAGVMEDGLVKPTEEGTPQGGPLSPLLSNIMLDDLDKELENRGLRFARYADDCNIYVKSERAGIRVMEATTRYLTEELKLKVNQKKSAVDRPWNRKFLGFTFTQGKDPNYIVVHESRIKRFKDKIRGLTKKMRGGKIKDSIQKLIMPITRGWANYFGIAEVKYTFDNLDGWIRRKIRATLWRQWKTARARLRSLRRLGLRGDKAKEAAYSSKGPWRLAKSHSMHYAVSNKVIEEMGYIPMKKIVLARS